MVEVIAPQKGFTGTVAGVRFRDGKGDTDDEVALAYFRRKGYGIGRDKPTGVGAGKRAAREVAETAADPRFIEPEHRGPIRDAAVDPAPGDHLAPVNAGKPGKAGNPHGRNVWR
jgi:hypothetical protein